MYWCDRVGKRIPGYTRKWWDMFVYSKVNFAGNDDAIAFAQAWRDQVACRLHLMGAECECTQECSIWGLTHPAASMTNEVVRM